MIRLFIIAILFGTLSGPPLLAEPPAPLVLPSHNFCGFYASMRVRLNRDYGEILHGWGISSPQTKVEIWANDETGTWTILVVYPDGRACVRAAGNIWTVVEHENEGDDT